MSHLGSFGNGTCSTISCTDHVSYGSNNHHFINLINARQTQDNGKVDSWKEKKCFWNGIKF